MKRMGAKARVLGGGAMAPILAISLAVSGMAATGAVAAPSDPAAAQVEALDTALVGMMKSGKALGFKGRYNRFRPAVQQAFDLQAMTKFTVGPAWDKITEAQRTALVTAFTRMITATYAHNFEAYAGERFTVDPKVDTRGPDKLVKSQLIAKGAPVALTYRMRQSGGRWKIIDVFYQGTVSELSTRRSDFAATLASGGAPALVQHLNALADKLSK
jgi:phospholipid transport system substrate-binding protein